MEKTAINLERVKEAYEFLCLNFAKRYEIEISDHVLKIMVSCCLTRDGILKGGGLAQAVANNDLYGAFVCADHEIRNNLYIITLCCKQCPKINPYE